MASYDLLVIGPPALRLDHPRCAAPVSHMDNLLHIVSAEPVIHGVLKIVWDDKYEGVVDLRPIMARGKIFIYLQSETNFKKVQVAEYGHSIGWINDAGYEIDFGCDRLREMAEEQAALIALTDRGA